MKVTIGMKSTFIVACALFIKGILLSDNSLTGAAVIIFVVLACTIEIIEAINKPVNKDSNKGD